MFYSRLLLKIYIWCNTCIIKDVTKPPPPSVSTILPAFFLIFTSILYIPSLYNHESYKLYMGLARIWNWKKRVFFRSFLTTIYKFSVITDPKNQDIITERRVFYVTFLWKCEYSTLTQPKYHQNNQLLISDQNIKLSYFRWH